MANDETLFWKVIHNKYLFKTIFNHIHKTEWVKYDDQKQYCANNRIKFKDIYNLKWMIDNKQFKLLKYKLESNEYINIDIEGIVSIINHEYWFSELSSSEDDEDNLETLKELFINLLNKKPIETYISVDILSLSIIYSNRQVIQILIDGNFIYQLTPIHAELIIKRGSGSQKSLLELLKLPNLNLSNTDVYLKKAIHFAFDNSDEKIMEFILNTPSLYMKKEQDCESKFTELEIKENEIPPHHYDQLMSQYKNKTIRRSTILENLIILFGYETSLELIERIDRIPEGLPLNDDINTFESSYLIRKTFKYFQNSTIKQHFKLGSNNKNQQEYLLSIHRINSFSSYETRLKLIENYDFKRPALFDRFIQEFNFNNSNDLIILFKVFYRYYSGQEEVRDEIQNEIQTQINGFGDLEEDRFKNLFKLLVKTVPKQKITESLYKVYLSKFDEPINDQDNEIVEYYCISNFSCNALTYLLNLQDYKLKDDNDNYKQGFSKDKKESVSQDKDKIIKFIKLYLNQNKFTSKYWDEKIKFELNNIGSNELYQELINNSNVNISRLKLLSKSWNLILTKLNETDHPMELDKNKVWELLIRDKESIDWIVQNKEVYERLIIKLLLKNSIGFGTLELSKYACEQLNVLNDRFYYYPIIKAINECDIESLNSISFLYFDPNSIKFSFQQQDLPYNFTELINYVNKNTRRFSENAFRGLVKEIILKKQVSDSRNEVILDFKNHLNVWMGLLIKSIVNIDLNSVKFLISSYGTVLELLSFSTFQHKWDQFPISHCIYNTNLEIIKPEKTINSGELIEIIETIATQYITNHEDEDGVMSNQLELNRIFKLILNYLYKRFIQIQGLSIEKVNLVIQVFNDTEIEIDHQLYHSWYYLNIKSPKLIKYILSRPLITNFLIDQSQSQFDCEILNDDTYDPSIYDIRNRIKSSKYTMDFIFSQSFNTLLESLKVDLFSTQLSNESINSNLIYYLDIRRFDLLVGTFKELEKDFKFSSSFYKTIIKSSIDLDIIIQFIELFMVPANLDNLLLESINNYRTDIIDYIFSISNSNRNNNGVSNGCYTLDLFSIIFNYKRNNYFIINYLFNYYNEFIISTIYHYNSDYFILFQDNFINGNIQICDILFKWLPNYINIIITNSTITKTIKKRNISILKYFVNNGIIIEPQLIDFINIQLINNPLFNKITL